MNLEVSREIAATPERVWEVMGDIERWPEWNASVTSVRPLDGRVLAVGSRFRIKQPGLPAMTWRVTSVDPGRAFAWVTLAPGSNATAVHRVEPRDGGARLTLALTHTGILGTVIARLLLGRTRRFVDMEADGLKARSEKGSSTEHPR